MSTNPVSPKVTVGAVTSAVVVIAMYLLGQVDFIAVWPTEVKAALFVIVTAAVTFVAGYLTRDPLRLLEGGEHRRTEAGAISTGGALLVAVVLLVLVAIGAFR